ncbi:Uncharacterised protein [Vibrio cholerae]|nr:Uncharacterised protein [Vibrio cholerae]
MRHVAAADKDIQRIADIFRQQFNFAFAVTGNLHTPCSYARGRLTPGTTA